MSHEKLEQFGLLFYEVVPKLPEINDNALLILFDLTKKRTIGSPKMHCKQRAFPDIVYIIA